jgi:hypothetical protein
VREQLEESERPGRHGPSQTLKQGDDKITISKGAGWSKPTDGQVLRVTWEFDLPEDSQEPFPEKPQQRAFVWRYEDAPALIPCATNYRPRNLYEYVFVAWTRDGVFAKGNSEYSIEPKTWDEITAKLNAWCENTKSEDAILLERDPETLSIMQVSKVLLQLKPE